MRMAGDVQGIWRCQGVKCGGGWKSEVAVGQARERVYIYSQGQRQLGQRGDCASFKKVV
jgi:hypothetical protein